MKSADKNLRWFQSFSSGQAQLPVTRGCSKASVLGTASFFLLLIFISSCTFDYGNKQGETPEQPDIVMEDVEYVRVRGGDPVVRFQAARAERYEEKQAMELKNFSFEQFENHGAGVDAIGSAGSARVELESGNINLENGVRISVDSEDIIIETSNLQWQDKERKLTGQPGGEVEVYRSDGTSFSGVGFSADARYRTWAFENGVSGTYIDEDDEEKKNDDAGDEATGDRTER
jgi:LPS export ABC transporter protein LptC